MSFECTRCGICCKELVNCLFWVGGNLTWQQKQDLIEERAKYPSNDGGCDMLYMDEDTAHCVVRDFLSEELRDASCKSYPAVGEECIGGITRTEDAS